MLVIVHCTLCVLRNFFSKGIMSSWSEEEGRNCMNWKSRAWMFERVYPVLCRQKDSGFREMVLCCGGDVVHLAEVDREKHTSTWHWVPIDSSFPHIQQSNQQRTKLASSHPFHPYHPSPSSIVTTSYLVIAVLSATSAILSKCVSDCVTPLW